MSALTPLPGSLRVVHGMEHAGLGPAALRIERSPAFKAAFVETISVDLGMEEGVLELGDVRPAGLHEFDASFGPDGHPPEEQTRAFLDRLLAERAVPDVTTGALLRDCCIRFLSGWLNCGGYALARDGAPWTVASAVEAFEAGQGAIEDPTVRAELATIAVYLQIEWVIPL